MIISIEAIKNANSIVLLNGWRAYDIATLFITLSFSYICVSASFINAVNWTIPEWQKKVSYRPTHWTYGLLSLFIFTYLLYAIPLAVTTFTSGRATTLELETSRTALQALLAGFGNVAGSILPAMIIFLFFFKRYSRANSLNMKVIIQAALLVSPILILQFLIGVRAVLLTTVISCAFVMFRIFHVRFKHVPLLLSLSSLLLLLTHLMKASRLGGGAALRSTAGGLDLSDFSEGVVEYFTRMVSYFSVYGYQGGREHLTLLLFWIPRAIWPDKPQQLENWFHSVVEPGKYPSFHSIAASFGATAYADYGFVIGILVCGIQGLLIGMIEYQVNRYLKSDRSNHSDLVPHVVLYASSIGIIFYSVRQFNSVPISIVTLLSAFFLFLKTFKR